MALGCPADHPPSPGVQGLGSAAARAGGSFAGRWPHLLQDFAAWWGVLLRAPRPPAPHLSPEAPGWDLPQGYLPIAGTRQHPPLDRTGPGGAGGAWWGERWGTQEGWCPRVGLAEPRPQACGQHQVNAGAWLAAWRGLGQRLAGGLAGGSPRATLCCGSHSHHLPAPAPSHADRVAVVS